MVFGSNPRHSLHQRLAQSSAAEGRAHINVIQPGN